MNERLANLSSEEKRTLLAQLLEKKALLPKPTPVSFAQERMWLLEQLNPGSTALNLSMSLHLHGPLNWTALERSLNEIMQRHETLRMAFAVVDEQPTQVVSPGLQCPLQVINITQLALSDRKAETQRLVNEATLTSFDLTQAPLMRAILIQLDEEEHLLHFVLHHIISDGWSLTILARELSTLYNAFVAGQASPLPQLPIQYTDFARWQREHMQGEKLAGQLDYWKQQLHNLPPLLELPTDYPRSPVRTFRSEHVTGLLTADLVKSLKQISQQEGATLFMTLLTAFQLLLSRHSGQEDIAVGSPVAGRVRADVDGLIGVFINNLVLRTDLSGNPTFRQLLKQVRTISVEAQAHQEVPFEKIIEALQIERSLSHTPLFQVMLNMLSFGVAQVEMTGLKVEFSIPPETDANFDLTIYAVERAGQIELIQVYNADLFDHVRMAELLNQYQALLQQVVEQPEQNIDRFSLVTPCSRPLLADPTQILPQPHYPTVPALFLEWARQLPEQSALCQSGHTRTYAEVEAGARALVGALQAQDIQAGQVVAVTGPRSCEFIIGMLAVLMNGDILLTLDRQLPVARQQIMLQEAGCRHIIYIGEPRPQDAWMWKTAATVIQPQQATGGLSPHPLSLPHLAPDDPAYIFFTSGTTGVPKGILGSHRGLSHFLTWQRQQFGVAPGDRSAQLTGLSFDVVLRDVFLPLTSGATLCLPDDPDDLSADRVLPWMEREDITLLHTVPTLAQTWLARRPENISLPSLRQVFFAGEPLNGSLITQWRSAFASGEIANFYGPTETTLAKCFYPVPQGDLAGVQPVGWPLPSTQVLVLANRDRLCGIGELGEIVIRTPFRTLGYINAPLSDQQRFAPNPFRPADEQDLIYYTGDRGRYRPDGAVEILGRLDDQVKIRGVRIEPGEINTVLSQHPAVRESVVLAREVEQTPGEKYLVAYAVAASHPAPSTRELHQFLHTQLPEYMVPAAILWVDAIPLTHNGKVDRRALPLPADDIQTRPSSAYAAPRTPIEESLVDIWTNVLKRDYIGIHDNFFELGGHSLLATQIVSRLRQIFQIELPVRALFEAPSIASMAQRVETALQGEQPQAPPMLPVSRNQPLLLSFSQERMWFIQQLQPDSSAYNMVPAGRLKGPLNLAALEYSLAGLVQRHEDLRTVFLVEDGQPVQKILPRLNLPVQVVDLRDLPEPERESHVVSHARQAARQPFDLTRVPLIRVTLYRLQDDEHILVLVMPHIISDAWSMGVMGREIMAFYNAFVSGTPAALHDLDIQYADFACWQRQWLRDDILAEQLAYWRTKLTSVPVLELPTDRPRSAIQTYRGAAQSIELSPSLLDALRQLSQKKGVSLFMTTLAAFKILLYRYTNQTDIALGVPVANRHWLAIENLIGTFVNTLVLRTDLTGDPTFSQLLEQVRSTALEAFTHQDLSFAKLVTELQLTRDTSHSPLFQVMFNVINVPTPKLNFLNLKADYFEVDRGGAQFDLTGTVIDVLHEHRITISYNTDLFNPDTIDRFIRHYEVLLKSIAANPDQPLHKLMILTGPERRQLLVEWNDTGVDYPREKCVYHLFEEQAEKTPQAIAVIGYSLHRQAEERVTYQELNRRANQLAHYLRKLGVGPGEYVGISLERTVEMVVGLLGILKAGGAYLPLDPAFPRERLAFMLQDTQTPVLLTQQNLLTELPQHAARVICLDNEWPTISQESEDSPPDGAKSADQAYILYTSGSTGKPKGVQIPHEALTNFLLSMQQKPGLTASDVLVSVTTLSFDIAGLELYLPLITGAQVVVVSRQVAADGVLLLKALTQYGATVMQATPATWRMMLEASWHNTPGLKMLCGGEALPWDLADKMLERGGALWNMYGPTETTIWSSTYEVQRGDESIHLGYPIANTQFYILDTSMQPVPIGVPGELYIGGDSVALGYFNRPDLTAERFLVNPFIPGSRIYKTGDLVRYHADSTIEFLGRADFQVKVRGFRIELGDIETALLQHEQVQQAVVVAHEDRSGDKRLVSYLIPQAQPAPTVGELRTYLKEKLPDYMIPSAFIPLQAFPLTPNGKIDRRALPAPDISQSAAMQAHVAPRNQTERQLAQIWAEVLGVPSVGVQDNFFDLGGHSLLVIRLFTQIEQIMGKQLPVATIFESPTIEQMANLIYQETEVAEWSPVVTIQRGKKGQPFFCVHGFGGGVWGYGELARLMGADRPVYGLLAKGENGHEEPLTQIEQMAEYCINAMRQVQPHGPYTFGGYCIGGVIAFEMARQLEAQGEEVALLAVFEGYAPLKQRRKFQMRHLRNFMRNLPFWLNDYLHTGRGLMLARLRRVARIMGKQFARRFGAQVSIALEDIVDDTSHIPPQHRKLMETQIQAQVKYVPQICSSPITLFRVQGQSIWRSHDPTLGWGELTTREVEIKMIKGAHYNILELPYVHSLAEQLKASLGDAVPHPGADE